jgi:hypothetical protein
MRSRRVHESLYIGRSHGSAPPPAHSSDPQAADIPGTGDYQSHTTCTCSWRTQIHANPFAHPTPPLAFWPLPLLIRLPPLPIRWHTTRPRPSGALPRSVPSFQRSLGVQNRTNSATSAEHPPCRSQAPERCGSGCVQLRLRHAVCLPGPVSRAPGLASPGRTWPTKLPTRVPGPRLPSGTASIAPALLQPLR